MLELLNGGCGMSDWVSEFIINTKNTWIIDNYVLGVYARYDGVKREIRICDYKSCVQMPIPFKKCETREEFKEYAEGYIDMLLRMGGK